MLASCSGRMLSMRSSTASGVSASSRLPSASSSSRVITQSPSPFAVEDHDLLHVGQFGAVCDQLVDLGLVLGHHDAASRIGDDECHVVGVGGRVDRGRGGTGAHHGEVDENPFVPRRRCQRDPVLGGDAQRDQPAEIRRTRSSTCCQVTLDQPSSWGYRNASACGVAATRSTNNRATDDARFAILVGSDASSARRRPFTD